HRGGRVDEQDAGAARLGVVGELEAGLEQGVAPVLAGVGVGGSGHRSGILLTSPEIRSANTRATGSRGCRILPERSLPGRSLQGTGPRTSVRGMDVCEAV